MDNSGWNMSGENFDIDHAGQFSISFASLQLQMKTLLEEVGGERALELLDSMARLSRSEQQIVLQSFTTIVNRVAGGSVRFESLGDKELKDFEEKLYSDILTAIEAKPLVKADRKLELVSNRSKIRNAPIDLSQARRRRENLAPFPKPMA